MQAASHLMLIYTPLLSSHSTALKSSIEFSAEYEVSVFSFSSENKDPLCFESEALDSSYFLSFLLGWLQIHRVSVFKTLAITLQ